MFQNRKCTLTMKQFGDEKDVTMAIYGYILINFRMGNGRVILGIHFRAFRLLSVELIACCIC